MVGRAGADQTAQIQAGELVFLGRDLDRAFLERGLAAAQSG